MLLPLERSIKMSSGIIGLLILLLCIVLFVTEWSPSVVTGALGCLLMVLFMYVICLHAFFRICQLYHFIFSLAL